MKEKRGKLNSIEDVYLDRLRSRKFRQQVIGDESRKIRRISAEKVLGEYDHELNFDGNRGMSIIYGPNGVGKTKFLECIDALSKVDIEALGKLPFRTASIEYSDGLRITAEIRSFREIYSQECAAYEPLNQFISSIVKDFSAMDPARNSSYLPDALDASGYQSLTLKVILDDEELAFSVPTVNIYLSNDRKKEELPFEYGNVRYDIERELRRLGNVKRRTPPVFRLLNSRNKVKLIEAQRLISYRPEKDEGGKLEAKHKIIENSAKIQELLLADMSSNSKLTQKLDSSFPWRMMQAGQGLDRRELQEGQADEVRERLSEQVKKRNRIADILPLGLDADIPIPDDEKLEKWQVAMLSLYLDDTEKKLESFSGTIAKINLLEDIINDRLLRKSINVTVDDGISITKDDGTEISLRSLSSGEQQEIVLFSDLLFGDLNGGIVLIDEPEISLHIGWQKKFVDDVVRVSELCGFQFIIATHSPQIMGKYWDIAQRLGPDPRQ
jgi:predicted ATPase